MFGAISRKTHIYKTKQHIFIKKEGVFLLRKIVVFVLAIILVFQNAAAAEKIGVSAASAVVIEAESGRVLYEKNAEDRRGMASTTKIMTAIVALEKGNPTDIVKISNHAANVEGSSMYLKAGEKITLENLVYGLMLVSGNDAATAIAEHISGSEEKFAALMNKKAKEIGANDTHFTNPHGLSDDEHYTTARDLAKIAAYGLENPVFAEIVSTKNKTIEREALGKTTLVNHNKLLKTYDGCIGVKTGFTKATGRCLVSASERNGLKIVCVTLNAGDDWNDHKNLCNNIFENYKATLYQREGTIAQKVTVKGGTSKELCGLYGEDIYLLEKEEGEWTIHKEVPKILEAPIEKGQVIGRVLAEHKSGETREFLIVAEKDIIKSYSNSADGFKERFCYIYMNWLKTFVS